jgi:YcxB-like protein
MSFMIEYASRRGEVWNWYWRTWRRRLWKTHLLTFFVVVVGAMAGIYIEAHGTLSPKSFLLAPALGLLSILWLPIYPQLRFKSQMRSLEVDQDGISTTIGKLAGRRYWEDILSISEQDDQIILLGRNGNAFLVPARAFSSIEEKQAFVSFVQGAQAAAASRNRPSDLA